MTGHRETMLWIMGLEGRIERLEKQIKQQYDVMQDLLECIKVQSKITEELEERIELLNVKTDDTYRLLDLRTTR